MRIRQYWTDERWIRITDDAQAPQYIAVNVIVGVEPMMNPETGQVEARPIVENQLAQMDVDIIIDESPDIVTLRQEEFEQLTQMAQAGIPVPPEMLIESSSIRNKARVLEMMQTQKTEQQRQQQIAMQMQGQAIQGEAARKDAEAQAKIVGTEAKAMRDLAEAEATRLDMNITAAELARRSAAIGL
jgi:hypothetical protein